PRGVRAGDERRADARAREDGRAPLRPARGQHAVGVDVHPLGFRGRSGGSGDPDRGRDERGGRGHAAPDGQGGARDRPGPRRTRTTRKPGVARMSTRAPAGARDAYLAGQAELGGEEVVLTAPWVRRAPATPGNAGAAGPGRAAPAAPSLPEVRFEPMKPFVVPG